VGSAPGPAIEEKLVVVRADKGGPREERTGEAADNEWRWGGQMVHVPSLQASAGGQNGDPVCAGTGARRGHCVGRTHVLQKARRWLVAVSCA
jgi:hypothetical protein